MGFESHIGSVGYKKALGSLITTTSFGGVVSPLILSIDIRAGC